MILCLELQYTAIITIGGVVSLRKNKVQKNEECLSNSDDLSDCFSIRHEFEPFSSQAPTLCGWPSMAGRAVFASGSNGGSTRLWTSFPARTPNCASNHVSNRYFGQQALAFSFEETWDV